jgi:hypothetical protein
MTAEVTMSYLAQSGSPNRCSVTGPGQVHLPVTPSGRMPPPIPSAAVQRRLPCVESRGWTDFPDGGRTTTVWRVYRSAIVEEQQQYGGFTAPQISQCHLACLGKAAVAVFALVRVGLARTMVGGPSCLTECWPGFLTGKWLCRARLTTRGQERSRFELSSAGSVMSAASNSKTRFCCSGGKSQAAGLVADDADCPGELDPVGVDAGRGRGPAYQRADRVMREEVPPDFLFHQVRGM